MAWLVYIGWVISQSNDWRLIPTILGKGQRFLGIWPPPTFYPVMVNLRTVDGAGGCVIQMLTCCNEYMMMLKVYWKSDLLLSQTQLVRISFCHVPCLCRSFKSCALPFPSYFTVTTELQWGDKCGETHLKGESAQNKITTLPARTTTSIICIYLSRQRYMWKQHSSVFNLYKQYHTIITNRFFFFHSAVSF